MIITNSLRTLHIKIENLNVKSEIQLNKQTKVSWYNCAGLDNYCWKKIGSKKHYFRSRIKI